MPNGEIQIYFRLNMSYGCLPVLFAEMAAQIVLLTGTLLLHQPFADEFYEAQKDSKSSTLQSSFKGQWYGPYKA